MASESRAAANGIKSAGVGSVSASVGDGPSTANNANHTNANVNSNANNNSNQAKKQWHWLNWVRFFPPNGRSSSNARVVPKSSEVKLCLLEFTSHHACILYNTLCPNHHHPRKVEIGPLENCLL
jgi:hypothetical protein